MGAVPVSVELISIVRSFASVDSILTREAKGVFRYFVTTIHFSVRCSDNGRKIKVGVNVTPMAINM